MEALPHNLSFGRSLTNLFMRWHATGNGTENISCVLKRILNWSNCIIISLLKDLKCRVQQVLLFVSPFQSSSTRRRSSRPKEIVMCNFTDSRFCIISCFSAIKKENWARVVFAKYEASTTGWLRRWREDTSKKHSESHRDHRISLITSQPAAATLWGWTPLLLQNYTEFFGHRAWQPDCESCFERVLSQVVSRTKEFLLHSSIWTWLQFTLLLT